MNNRLIEAKEILKKYNLQMVDDNSFINFTKKIDILCKCKVNIINNNISSIKYGKGVKCIDCRNKELSNKNRKNFNTVKLFIENNSSCIVLSTEEDYKNNRTKLKIRCVCQDLFYRDFHTIRESIQNKVIVQCIKCRYGHIEKDEIIKIANENKCEIIDVQLTNGLILARNKITIQCQCSNIFVTKVSHFSTHGTTRCKTCTGKISKAEKKIAEILECENIEFKSEYTFKDLKGTLKLLPFDFAILKDGSLKGIIEFDGKQHFEAIKMFGGEEGLAITQQNDYKKNQYCKDNKIPLRRISYKEEKHLKDIILTFADEIL